MMQEGDLRELAELVGQATPMLSLYLNVDPHRRSADDYRLPLRQLLGRAVEQGADPADIERIERFFDHEYNRQGRSVVCFSLQAEGIWRAYPLLVPVEDFVFVGRRPYIKPLGDLLDRYDRIGVITVDREGARAFVFHLGALEDSGGTLGAEVKRHKQGGWAAQRLQRHEDEEARHNLKDAAVWADEFLRRHNVTRVVLSGSEGNLAQFRELLPRSLQDRVIGQISLDMNASPAEVWERAYTVAQEADRAADEALIEQVVTVARKGGAGATGLAETLTALQQGRVFQLLVDPARHRPGQQCSQCDALMLENLAACPYCGGTTRPIPDIVDFAVHQAVECGVKVAFIEHSSQLAEADGMAAVLRY